MAKYIKTADGYKLKVGENVAGTAYVINSEEVVAGNGAEIFNSYVSNIASGDYSHAEGYNTTASGNSSHVEGRNTTASGNYSHAEGLDTTAFGNSSHAEGLSTTASGVYSHAEGLETTAFGNSSHAEGQGTNASGESSHAEGFQSTSSGESSHAEGYSSNKLPTAITTKSTNEEILTAWNNTKFSLANGNASHVEGINNLALKDYSHAEGKETTASGYSSHAEGISTTASGSSSHAEGFKTTASGEYSHAEGFGTTASGSYSHAEGRSTTASGDYQHAQGQYNIVDEISAYAHIVGNGTTTITRSNAHTLDWNGVGWFQGGLQVGGNAQDDGAKNVLLEGDAIPAPEIATVGQVVRVSEVDENGKPITWEAIDLPVIPRMPSIPQFDITTTELARYIWLDTLNDLPLESYGYTEMRVSVANVPQETATASEFQVQFNAESINLNSNPYIAAPTSFISGTSQQYWGGYINIRDGNIWGMSNAMGNPRWRTNIASNADPTGMFDDEAIKTIKLNSVLTDIPVGTNIKIWMC